MQNVSGVAAKNKITTAQVHSWIAQILNIALLVRHGQNVKEVVLFSMRALSLQRKMQASTTA